MNRLIEDAVPTRHGPVFEGIVLQNLVFMQVLTHRLAYQYDFVKLN